MVDLGADFYFHKGRNDHVACQDYAVVGKAVGRTYAILTDGCSSSPDTDIGARIIALTAQGCVFRGIGANLFQQYHDVIPQLSQQIVRSLGVPMECLDATLLTLIVEDGWIKSSLYGDGFVAVKYKDGWIRGVQCSYPGGYPRYLSYRLDAARAKGRDSAKSPAGEPLDTKGYSEPFRISPKGELVKYERTEFGESFEFCCPIPDDAVAVYMTSDGILQFAADCQGGRKSVPFEEVLSSLLSISQYAGCFVQRSARFLFQRECLAKKWTPLDDVSIVGIRLAKTEAK